MIPHTRFHRAGPELLWPLMLAIAACVLLFTPMLAFAQSMGDLPTLDQLREGASDSTARNIFRTLLGQKFADAPLVSVGGATHLLGMVFFIFNGALFVVGVGFILYKSIMMVAVSANEGAVLGKNMSSLWIPIRLGTGIFGMAPVFMGFSLAQAAMFSVALLGNGLADMMAKTAIEANNDFHVIVPAPGIKTVANEMSIDTELARTLFGMHVCASVYNAYMQKIEGTNAEFAAVTRNENELSVRGVGVECGGVKIVNQIKDTIRSGDSMGFRNPAVQYDNIAVMATAIHAGRMKALYKLDDDVKALANSWLASYLNGGQLSYPSAELLKATFSASDIERIETQKQYEAAAKQASDAMSDGKGAVTDRAKQKMSEGGWMSLGSWYSTFAESNSAMQSASSATYFDVIPMNLNLEIKIPESVALPLGTLKIQSTKFDDDCHLIDVNLYVTDVKKLPYERNAVGACTPMQNGFLWLLDKAVGDSGGEGMVNPVIAAKNLGDWLLVGVGSVVGVSMGAMAVDWAADKIKPIGWIKGAVSKVTGFFSSDKPEKPKSKGLFSSLTSADPNGFGGKIVSMILIAALVLGLVLAVYVPMIPFITWFTACVSYFASVIEGLVAAQVWAFSHLHTDGEGMGQRAERGYIFMLNMLLRPPLMNLGFFFASGILTLMGTFLFLQLGPALANAQGNTMTGPFIIMGYTGLITIVLLSLVQTVFNMIYEIPDRVIAWFGGGMEARMAQNMDREIEGKMGRAAQWSGNAVLARGVAH